MIQVNKKKLITILLLINSVTLYISYKDNDAFILVPLADQRYRQRPATEKGKSMKYIYIEAF